MAFNYRCKYGYTILMGTNPADITYCVLSQILSIPAKVDYVSERVIGGYGDAMKAVSVAGREWHVTGKWFIASPSALTRLIEDELLNVVPRPLSFYDDTPVCQTAILESFDPSIPDWYPAEQRYLVTGTLKFREIV